MVWKGQILDKCVFCASSDGMTEEHVYSQWIAELRDLQPAGLTNMSYTVAKVGDPRPWHVEEEDQFSLHHMRPKMVCASCNSGWMSRLETRVQPILSPLMLSPKRRTLSIDDLAVVSSWAALKAMTGEFMYRWEESVGYPRRHSFMINGHTPPPGTLIWLGRGTGDGFNGRRSWQINATTISHASDSTRRNTQMVGFNFGHLAILVIMSHRTFPPGLRLPAGAETGLRPAWPNPRTQSWPPPTRVAMSQLAKLMDGFEQLRPRP